MNRNEVSIGCDGEGFFLNGEGSPIPSVGLLGGSKGRPKACEGGGYQEDCVAWEINPDPVGIESGGKPAFISNVGKCLDEVRRQASLLDLEVDISPSKLFKKKDLSTEQSLVSGCSESFDCWELTQLEAIDLTTTNTRFAGGDIHVGFPWAEDFLYSRINMARALDIFIGLSEVVATNKTRRSIFYGKAGIHRPTSYGVEYKTCGNFWMRGDEWMGWVFDVVVEAERLVRNQMRGGKGNILLFGKMGRDVVKARNSWNKKLASSILSLYKLPQYPG